MSVRLGLAIATLIAFATPCPLVQAQDFGSLLRGINQIRGLPTGANDLVSAIVSIAEVSTGRVADGVPVDQITGGQVVLYRTATCGYCKQAAAYMRSRQIAFAERDVDTSRLYQAEFKRLNGRGVPLIVMGDKTISGFSAESFDKGYAEFQAAHSSAAKRPDIEPGYPKAPPSNGAGSAADALHPGDVLVSRISGVALYREPLQGSARLATLGRADEMVYVGEQRNGMVRVAAGGGEGWVDRILVTPHQGAER